MAVTFTPVSPLDLAQNIEPNTEVVFNLQKIDGLNLASLDVTFDDGMVAEAAMTGGVFVNNYTGEIIDHSNGMLTDVTVAIIRPLSSPVFAEGKTIEAGIDVDLV